MVKAKAQTSWDARPIRLPIIKSWVTGNVGSWYSTRSLVNYLHYVCAKIHPNRRTFSVKVLARRKVAGPKSSNFTRCPNFSASKDTISSQGELRKLKLCINLIKYFQYVCAKFHPDPTVFRVKGLTRKKSGQSKKHKLHEMLDLLCFRRKNLEPSRV